MTYKESLNWKELKIDDLPSDILTGDYELGYLNFDEYIMFKNQDPFDLFTITRENFFNIFYRKPETKAPPHRERMTKWWRDCDGNWYKPVAYGHEKYYMSGNTTFLKPWDCQKDWFTGRESAYIPPEA